VNDEHKIWTGDCSRSLSEVRDRAARLATALHSAGVREGSRVAVIMRNDTAFLEASLAIGRIGGVPVPLNWHWTGEDLRHALRNSRSRLIIVHTDLLDAAVAQTPDIPAIEVEESPAVRSAYRLSERRPTGRWPIFRELIDANEAWTRPPPAAAMAVIYTSGTTGLSKGVLRNPIGDEARMSIAQSMATLFQFRPGETTMAPAPLYHAAPNMHATFAMALSMNLHVLPRFDAELFLRTVEEHQVSTVQVVPTMLTRMLQLPEDVRRSYDLSSLTAVITAAAPCPHHVKEAIIEWLGPVVYEYYGGAEVGVLTKCDSAEAMQRPGTVGKPILDCGVKILDEDGGEKPSGQDGIVFGKPFTGWPDFTYIDDDSKRRQMDKDGYLTLGDIGQIDDDGYLYLSDRLNDMVISGGVNIYPAEIESCLLEMDEVADVAVFGIPDPDLGEALAAHVQLRPGAALTVGDVTNHVVSRLARYKSPRVVVFDAELPREDTGKLFKRRLKERYWTPVDAGERPAG
jgi:long-chain acyl-CoA synthetase